MIPTPDGLKLEPEFDIRYIHSTVTDTCNIITKENYLQIRLTSLRTFTAPKPIGTKDGEGKKSVSRYNKIIGGVVEKNKKRGKW